MSWKRFACALILALLCWPVRSTLGLLDERDLVSRAQVQPLAWHVRFPRTLAPRPPEPIEAHPAAIAGPPDGHASDQSGTALETAATSAHTEATAIELKARLDDAERPIELRGTVVCEGPDSPVRADAFRTAVADAETELAAGELGIRK